MIVSYASYIVMKFPVSNPGPLYARYGAHTLGMVSFLDTGECSANHCKCEEESNEFQESSSVLLLVRFFYNTLVLLYIETTLTKRHELQCKFVVFWLGESALDSCLYVK